MTKQEPQGAEARDRLCPSMTRGQLGSGNSTRARSAELSLWRTLLVNRNLMAMFQLRFEQGLSSDPMKDALLSVHSSMDHLRKISMRKPS